MAILLSLKAIKGQPASAAVKILKRNRVPVVPAAFFCDECDDRIVDVRNRCVKGDCPNYDVCRTCRSKVPKGKHEFLRFRVDDDGGGESSSTK